MLIGSSGFGHCMLIGSSGFGHNADWICIKESGFSHNADWILHFGIWFWSHLASRNLVLVTMLIGPCFKESMWFGLQCGLDLDARNLILVTMLIGS